MGTELEEDKDLLEFTKLMRAGKFDQARQLLPSSNVTDPPCWHLARLDLERLQKISLGEEEPITKNAEIKNIYQDRQSLRRQRNILTAIRPLEVGFTGHWLIMMMGFLPLVVGVLALEYPPLWFGVVLSLFGLGEIWFGKKIMQGWNWIPKVLWIHNLIFLVVFGLSFVAMLSGGENFWREVGGRRGVILPYGIASFWVAQFLIWCFLKQGNVKSYFGMARRKSDYQIAEESVLKPLQWIGIVLLVLAAGALLNFLNLDPKTRLASPSDPLTLPLELPGSDYLARIWVILYSLLFPYFNPNVQILDINALITAQRLGSVFAFLLLAIAGWGLWRCKWWSWGMGLGMAVILGGSLGDLFRLMGNEQVTSMAAVNMLVNLGLAVGLILALLRKGVKLALGADADADLALSFTQKTIESRKAK